MTILGGFSMGSAPSQGGSDPSGSTAMNMSLDEMIAHRRRQQQQEKKVDESVARSRARRQAVMDKKRGLSDSAKPTRIQVEAAIEKQEVKTAQLAKASADKKSKAKGAQTGKPKLDPTLKQDLKPKDPLTTIKTRREIKKIVKEAAAFTRGTKAIAAIPLAGKAPSRKAVNAAVDAMEKAGYTVPEGMQMVITLAPTDVTDLAISSKLESQKKAADVDMEPIATAEKSGKAPRGRGRGRAK